jgi:tetratricopeptide (TPR) repeat protein
MGMEIKFHKRQIQQHRRLMWLVRSGAVLVIAPRGYCQPRSQLKSRSPLKLRPQSAVVQSWLAKEDRDRLLRQRALYAAQNGDFVFAIQAFNHLIKLNPKSAADFNNRGLVFFQSGQLASALADYNRAIECEPNLANVYNNRANYYAALGELALAIDDYDQAIRIDPMNVRAWINQGITFREMDMYEQAIENFTYALDINQHTADTNNRLVLDGHVFAERGRSYHLAGDWNCAVAEYHQALEILNIQEDLELVPSIHLQQQLEEWLRELTHPLMGGNLSSGDLDFS